MLRRPKRSDSPRGGRAAGRFSLLLLLVVPLELAAADRSDGPRLTIPELFRTPRLHSADLSPRGTCVAGIMGDELGAHHLVILDLQSEKLSAIRGDTTYDVYAFAWLDEQRLLFNVAQDKLYARGLLVAHRARPGDAYPLISSDVTQLIATPRARPNHALVAVLDSMDATRVGKVFDIDVTRVPRRPAGGDEGFAHAVAHSGPRGRTVTDWLADQAGELALCTTFDAGEWRLYRRIPGQREWTAVPLSPRKQRPVAVEAGQRFVWVVDYAPGTGFRLQRHDLDTGETEPPAVIDPLFDLGLGTVHFSPKTGRFAGITYPQRRMASVWVEDAFRAAQDAVDHHHKDTDNVLVDVDVSEQKFVFHCRSPQQPGLFVLLDLTAKKLSAVGSTASWLKPSALQPTLPMSYTTRDGVKVEGYITWPRTGGSDQPVPLVVMPHGGPWRRDEWKFDPAVQMLADRGYAVLQPNYRGSSGYAPHISVTHEFDFRRMHDDVTDATRAMLRTGRIDPQRVAIMGGSFGGYLALAGVAFEKDLYRAAISLCGVFDWEALVRTHRVAPGAAYDFLVHGLGRPGRDREQFDAISPLKHATNITVPVFIAHGNDDAIVAVSQSRKLAAALRQHRIPHETFFRRLEGHNFYNEKNRIQFYEHVEAFLAKHVGKR